MMNSVDRQPFFKLPLAGEVTAILCCLLISLVIILFFQNCTSDNKKRPQPPTPVTTTAPAPQESISETPQENKESPVGKSVEELQENKLNRVGVVPTGKDAELNRTLPAPPIVPPAKKSAPSGPTGYISRNDVVLQSEPLINAPQTRTFKIYEEVIILETKMADEAGIIAEYPKWYRVRCSDKKEGWVVARSVTVN